MDNGKWGMANVAVSCYQLPVGDLTTCLIVVVRLSEVEDK